MNLRLILSLTLLLTPALTVSAGVAELRLEDQEPARVAAHRGASAIAPENTTASIARAVEAKADLIEFDVRATADGKLLLFHDKTLERYGGGKKHFAELSSEEALALDVGSFFDAAFSSERPPTLADAVTQCLEGNSIPLIEHKTGSAAAYSAVLRELKAVDKVVVQSFNWKFLTELRALEPDLKLGALGDDVVDEKVLTDIAKFTPDMVGWKDSDITTPAIEAFHSAGYAVAIWTVNDERRMKALAQSGVDIIITDKPAQAKAALNEK
jgi:glycerophosphoryl diester phosphodiesterase